MFQLSCPDVEPPCGSLGREFERVGERLIGLSDKLGEAAPDSLVGFEVRAALRLVRAGKADSKTRALLFRPALEPILLLHGEKVWSDTFNQIDALAMACSLSGRELSFRFERCFGQSEVGDVEFEHPDRVQLWLPAIRTMIKDHSSLVAGAMVFARTITAHPMTDGNGRLARALVHALLLKDQRRPVAPIALAPAFYGRRNGLAKAIIDLCRTRDWNPYYQTFTAVLELSMAMSDA